MNELECIVAMFINEDYIGELINDLHIDMEDMNNNYGNKYCVGVIIGKIAPYVREYIKSLCFSDFNYKEINKAMSNVLYTVVKNHVIGG